MKTYFPYLHGFILSLIFLFSLSSCMAQNDPEFPRGFIFYVKLHDGMVSKFNSSPELFVGGVQLAPQFTAIPNLLRTGLIAGGFFSANKIQGEFGPTVSVKLKTFHVNLKNASIGSFGNVNIRLDPLWGTGKQRLLGGGHVVDLGNLVTIGITAYRDYQLNSWWFQSEVGLRISRKKKNTEI